MPTPVDMNTREYWLIAWVGELSIWTTLWLVKASFLALCWIIFHVSASFRKAWWVVAVYTALGYWPIILMHLWNCGVPSNVFNPVACIIAISEASSDGRFLTIAATEGALHLSSELLILALPLVFIQQLQMSKAQKLSAAGVFGVVIITITLGSLRTMAYVANDSEFHSNVSASVGEIGGTLEPPLAVLVCALLPYKVLLTKFQERKERAAIKRQNAESKNRATAPLPRRHNTRRNFGIQDSITELEMA